MKWWDKVYLDKRNEVRAEVNADLREISRGNKTYTEVIVDLRERLSHLEAKWEVEEVRIAGLREAEKAGMIPNVD